tara:strand:+ start:812 stop:1033 length:222 start_codon:yes stop_codon:yes gene_type:complete
MPNKNKKGKYPTKGMNALAKKRPDVAKKIMGYKEGGLTEATAKLKAQGLKAGGPVRGKARGMGAATKGGGYNV